MRRTRVTSSWNARASISAHATRDYSRRKERACGSATGTLERKNSFDRDVCDDGIQDDPRRLADEMSRTDHHLNLKQKSLLENVLETFEYSTFKYHSKKDLNYNLVKVRFFLIIWIYFFLFRDENVKVSVAHELWETTRGNFRNYDSKFKLRSAKKAVKDNSIFNSEWILTKLLNRNSQCSCKGILNVKERIKSRPGFILPLSRRNYPRLNTFEWSQKKNFLVCKERLQICGWEFVTFIRRRLTSHFFADFGFRGVGREPARWNSNCKKPSCAWTKGSPRVTEKIAPGEKFYREKGGLGATSCAVQRSELRSAAIKRSQHDSVAIYGEEIAALLQAR